MSIVHIHVMIMLLTCFVASIDGLLVTYDVNITLNLLHFKEPLESRPTVGTFDVMLLLSLGLGRRSCQTEVLRWRVTLLYGDRTFLRELYCWVFYVRHYCFEFFCVKKAM